MGIFQLDEERTNHPDRMIGSSRGVEHGTNLSDICQGNIGARDQVSPQAHEATNRTQADHEFHMLTSDQQRAQSPKPQGDAGIDLSTGYMDRSHVGRLEYLNDRIEFIVDPGPNMYAGIRFDFSTSRLTGYSKIDPLEIELERGQKLIHLLESRPSVFQPRLHPQPGHVHGIHVTTDLLDAGRITASPAWFTPGLSDGVTNRAGHAVTKHLRRSSSHLFS